MPHHYHLVQLDDLVYEGLQRLQTLLGTVILHGTTPGFVSSAKHAGLMTGTENWLWCSAADVHATCDITEVIAHNNNAQCHNRYID